MDRFWGWRNWRQFSNIIISYQKQHFNIWSNILQLLDNHIIASFLLYAAYKNDFLISSFSSFSVSYPSVFWRVSFVIFFLQIYIECNTMLPLEVYYKTYVDAWCSEVNITFVSTICCTIRPLVQNLNLICAYVCTPVCLCQRTHKYYNVSFRIWVIKVFISVKMRLKNELFSEKIWWNGK